MTKIKNIGKTEIRMLVKTSLESLQRTLNKYGVTVEQAGQAKYGGHNMTVKIEFKVPKLANEREETDYNRYMEMYEIKAPYGFEFQAKGKTYRVAGINHNAPKNRVLLEASNGRKAHCGVDMLNWEHIRSQANGKREVVVNG